MTDSNVLKLSTSGPSDIFVFDSVADIDAYIDASKYRKQETRFTGEELAEWEDVQKKLKEAWEKGIVTMKQFVERLRNTPMPEIKDHMIRTTFSTEGDEVDFDRLMAGQPAHFRKTERREKSGPTEMTIVIDTSTPYWVNPDDILWRGAAAIALTQILEEKGYKVELWVINGSNLYREVNVMTACRLKRPQDPLDVSTLINTVSGWFYRTAIFTLLETICEKEGQYKNSGYGNAYTANESELDLITVDELRLYSSGVFTFDGAVSLIEAQMLKLAEKSQSQEGEAA